MPKLSDVKALKIHVKRLAVVGMFCLQSQALGLHETKFEFEFDFWAQDGGRARRSGFALSTKRAYRHCDCLARVCTLLNYIVFSCARILQ